MSSDLRRQRSAAALAIASAFLWATWFFFVLGSTPAVAPSGLIFYPFFFGGAAYLAWCWYQGHLRTFLGLWRSPIAWARVGLLVAMQVSVLAATYLTGPVDTSLLSLIGDVVIAPILLMAFFGEGRSHARSPPFLSGLGLSLGGAALTIVAGTSVRPIAGWGWVVSVIMPLVVSVYFLNAARAGRTVPTSAIVAQATIGAALVTLPVSVFLPGGLAGLGGFPPVYLVLMIGLGVTSFYLAPVLYFWAVERGGLILTSLMMATIPVFTLLLQLAITHVAPPTLAILGIPIALVGAALAIRGPHAPWTPTYGDAASEPPPTVTETL